MKSEASLNLKSAVRVAFFLCIMCLLSLPAYAHYYEGDDWGGRDLILFDGDSLSGSFVNVGLFSIPVGVTISGTGGNLSLNAGVISIDGALKGDPLQGYDLFLTTTNNLIINGSISDWRTITLAGNSIEINGTVSVIDGTIIGPPSSGELGSGLDLRSRIIPVENPGGLISIVPAPVPAAAWLLGSGLPGLVGIRRKMK